MRFTESKRRSPIGLISVGIIIIVAIVLALGFCTFQPAQKMAQKTIVFEAD